MSGTVQIAGDTRLRFEQGLVIRREWEPTKKGAALMRPGTRHWVIELIVDGHDSAQNDAHRSTMTLS